MRANGPSQQSSRKSALYNPSPFSSILCKIRAADLDGKQYETREGYYSMIKMRYQAHLPTENSVYEEDSALDA